MTKEQIEKTLTAELYRLSERYSFDVAYVNKEYDPVIGTPYIAQWFLDSAPTDMTLAKGSEKHNGIMQLDITVPYDSGNAEIYRLLAILENSFKTNAKIRNDEGMVQLHKVYLSGHNIDNEWYARYMTIEYSAFAQNE